jgi:hypothetical protein
MPAYLSRETWRHTPPTVPSSRRRCGRLLPQTLFSGAMILCITVFQRAAMPPTRTAPCVSLSTGGCSATSTKQLDISRVAQQGSRVPRMQLTAGKLLCLSGGAYSGRDGCGPLTGTRQWCRKMVLGLHRLGLRMVLDVVYNHTFHSLEDGRRLPLSSHLLWHSSPQRAHQICF